MAGLIQKIFLRNPIRNIPKDENLIISPAHGKIIKVFNFSTKEPNKRLKLKKGLFGRIGLLTKDIADECIVICIMMNIHNIHIQRSPISGIITSQKHSSGTFSNVVFGAKNLSWLENEKNEIIIENKKLKLKLKVVQVAGLLARRIISYVKPKDKINKGQDIGHIALGSEVILILPKKDNIKILVKENQDVTDGETVIARIK